MSFSGDISKYGVKTVQEINNIRRGVMIKLFSAIILDTPVLTGRLRGNWQFSKSAPITTIIDRVDPNGQQVQKEGIAVAMGSNGDEAVYMTNNLPYAERIEYDGYSAKAPEGMVRRNVVRFNQLIQLQAQNPDAKPDAQT